MKDKTLHILLIILLATVGINAYGQSRRSVKWNTEATDRLYSKFKTANENRKSFMLKQGEPIIDYAVYLDEDTVRILTAAELPDMVNGTNYQVVVREHLERMFAEDGELIVPHDSKFSQLLMAKSRKVSAADKGKIAELQSMLDVVTPDVQMPMGCDMPFSHRLTQMEDIYCLTNERNATCDGKFSFRCEGTSVELWDEESGARYSLPAITDSIGRTMVHLTLLPGQSFFVVFRHYGDASARIIPLPNGTFNIPRSEVSKVTESPKLPKNEQKNVKEVSNSVVAVKKKQPEIPSRKTPTVSADPSIPSASVKDNKVVKEPTGFVKNWAIEFNMKLMHKPTVTTQIQRRAFYIMRPPTLNDWTRNSDTRIKYYSGVAVYRNTFNTADAVRRNTEGKYVVAESNFGNGYTLSIEEAHDSVRVFVNGEEVGLLIAAPYEMDITPFVIRGNNAIELHVSNGIRNRMVGDLNIPEELRILKKVDDDITRTTPLKPAGIVGNVRIVRRPTPALPVREGVGSRE